MVRNRNNNNVIDPFNHPSASELGIVSLIQTFDNKIDQTISTTEFDERGNTVSDIQESILPFAQRADLDLSTCVSDSFIISAGFDEHVFDEA